MHKKTTVICGESDIIPDFAAIGNNPNFVFQNDPDFETINDILYYIFLSIVVYSNSLI